jgi:membrane-associated phospholipid phosphatase
VSFPPSATTPASGAPAPSISASSLPPAGPPAPGTPAGKIFPGAPTRGTSADTPFPAPLSPAAEVPGTPISDDGPVHGLAWAEHFDKVVDGFFEAHFRGRPAVDLVMYAASALGDHSAVWLALAALQGVRSGQGWRPLLRAGALLGAESVLVNGLVKLAFRRQRPEATQPRPLPLRTPLTSSFPSGHASAAFFAAALLRGSRWGPVYYLLAATVASSRAHVRIHHPSDVVAGAALGAALGELARAAFPLLPPDC